MNLINIAVKRPVTTIMVTLIVLLLGFISVTRIPIDLLPKFEVPIAIVSTNYRGIGPKEMEKLITIPLEGAIATVDNIKNIRSVTTEGNSIVIAEFNFGTDMDFAALDIREKVDLVKSYLPKESSNPIVLKIDPNAMPIIEASLSGGNLDSLQKFGEDIVKLRLERIEGVASVDIVGGNAKVIEIVLDKDKANNLGISIDYISSIISAENLNLPGGNVKTGNKSLMIRTIGEFKSIEDIKNLSIPLRTGGIVYLKDISEINLKNIEKTTISRVDGVESIGIRVTKQSGTNTVKVANKVNKEIKNILKEYKNINISTVIDQSEYIRVSIDNVVESTVLGGTLAVIILFLFFRNIRSTLIIATSIPISIVVTFILLYFSDITLNLMTLGGLALGIGMLVDNAIVVIENIYRFREDGFSKVDSAILGAKEVSMAVTASTLTTVAVFLPIVFVEGITSTIFKELAITVSFSLFASLIVSITLIPMLSSKILKIDTRNKSLLNNFLKSGNKIYVKLLKSSLAHRKTTVFIGLTIFVLSVLSVFNVGAEFFPEMDEGEFIINVRLPEGSELESTNKIVTIIENRIKTIDEIETIFSSIGGGDFRFGESNRSNRATINVSLKKLSKRETNVKVIADKVRNMLKDIPGAKIEVEVLSTAMIGTGFKDAISIGIKGEDIEVLKKISLDIIEIVKNVSGTREVKSNLVEVDKELQIDINRINSSKYGLTLAQIASSIRNTIAGKVSTRYKQDGNEIDVVVKGDKYYSLSIENLKQLPIKTPLGITVPLSELANIKIAKGPSSINRDGQSREITISSQIINRDLQSISNEINNKLKNYKFPLGYTYEFKGQNKELKEAFDDLRLAIILAVALVYMILASQFESMLHPFTIMLSVPLAFSGGALGLLLTNRAVSVPALIGAMVLSGIVVNDSIVLVDYINTRRKKGEDRLSAIINAGSIRLRPILITTLTTILGLLPLAIGIGEGSEAMAPLSTVVIGGLTLATLLTLVFIPTVYTIFDDIKLLRN